MDKLVKQLTPVVIAAAHELDEILGNKNDDCRILSTKEAVVKALLSVAYSFFPAPQNLDEINQEIIEMNEVIFDTNEAVVEYLCSQIKQRKGMH